MKSPCKKCKAWAIEFPRCIENCKILCTFQTTLIKNRLEENRKYDDMGELTVFI